MWTDAANWFGRRALAHEYNSALAAAFGVALDSESKTGEHIVGRDGKMVRIDQIAEKFDAWYRVIEEFIGKLQARLGEE